MSKFTTSSGTSNKVQKTNGGNDHPPTLIDALLKKLAFIRGLADLTPVRETCHLLSTSRQLKNVEEKVFRGYKLPKNCDMDWEWSNAYPNPGYKCSNVEGRALFRALARTTESRWLSWYDTSEVKSMTINSENRVTDKEMSRLFGEGRFSQLTSLSIQDCFLITDLSVTAVAQGCPHLESLSIISTDSSGTGEASNITDAGVKELIRGCPKLYDLNFYGCCKISNASAKELSFGCPNLKYLDVGGGKSATAMFSNIDDTGVKMLAQGCPQLVRLDMENCGVSSTCINALKESHPKISIWLGFSDDDDY